MMSSSDKKSGGRKDPTGRTRHPTLPPLPPPDISGKQSLIGLADIPKINEALLHQARQAIISAPDLVDLLRVYGSNLRKLERSTGRDPTGSAPFVARFLAESILLENPEGVDLPRHPIALMVAAALAAHYEGIGDLIGNRIYRDLNRVYLLLAQDRKKNLFEAEKIILQNVERDPFNLWFIHLGLSVSRELAEEGLAKKEPEFFEQLLQTRQALPDTWEKSIYRRVLYEKIVVKFRQNPMKFLWQMVTLYGFGMGLLFPHVGSIAEILRFSNRGAKGGKYLKGAPGLLEGYRRKTRFEIELYHGDYRGALQGAEPNSPLIKLAEYLEAQQKGDRFEEEIELESIPKLNPQAVKQTEALAKLEEKLAQSTVVSLEGIPGSAKTYLAVQLANKYKNDNERWVFWYTIREGKKPDLKRALDHLAFFIQTQDPENHRGLLSQVQERSRLEERVALLAPLLQKNPISLFLDNFHVVLEDREAVALIQKMVPLNIGRSKIVTVIRRSEDWLQKRGAQIFRREEMSFEEAQDLYTNLGILNHFTEEQMKEVYQLTSGRPMALGLLGELVRCGEEEALPQILEDLRNKENRAQVTQYLFDKNWETLPVEQKIILQYLSLFRDPVPKEAFVFLGQTDDARLKSHLIHLEEAFLVEERNPGIYELQDRYKKLTSLHFPLEDSQELHHRAAEFYRTTARHPRDFLEAAHHFFEAGEHDRSVKMMTKWIPLLLKRGYVERVAEFLNRFTDSVRLRREDRAAIILARGDLAHFSGETQLSLEHYKKALSIFRALDDDKSIGLVLSRIANVQDLLGDWERALKTYAKSLPFLKEVDDEKGMAQNYNNMGMIFHAHGIWDKAHQYFHESLLLKEKLGDRKGIAETLYNLGLMERDRENKPKALEILKKSLELHRELKTPDLGHIETIIQDLEKG